MSSNFPTLPTGPFEHVALDYARLRAEGIRLLGRLTGQQWTDFNTHDPGITILEQLCYAITDLAYRTSYPIQDLLAGAEQGLVPPAAILSTNPVTLTDLRKLALDDEGIENAWAHDEVEPELVFHYQEGGKFGFGPGNGQFDTGQVSLRGLHQVLLQWKDTPNWEDSRQAIITRFHQSRGLGEDFQFAELEAFKVKIRAEVDVEPIVNTAAVQTAIYDRISEYLTPPIRFVTPSDAQASGQRFEQIFEGPALSRGVLMAVPDKRQVIYTSDLIHAIMDVPEVRGVRSLELEGKSTWMLEVPPGMCARLNTDPGASSIRFHIGAGKARAKQAEAPAPTALVPIQALPSGRERGLGNYSSIQEQLPAAYGLGALGLPASAPVWRQAQVRQLQAYLVIFDQLLANAFAQLAHAPELLVPAAEDEPTYFGQPIDDVQLQALLDSSGGLPHEQGNGDDGDRRKRFLAHLLARFGEHLGEHLGDGALANWMSFSPEHRKSYLERFPQLSAGRGSGADVLGWVTGQDLSEGVSLFEERIRARLGLLDDIRFHVIEHVLLRPIAEDANQVVDGEPNPPPLLDSEWSDPWSLQISVVFAQHYNGEAVFDPAFETEFVKLVKQTLLAETPAHLTVHLHFVSDTDGIDVPSSWEALEDAWAAFRELYGEYRRVRSEQSEVDPMLQLHLRDARDRLIEMFELGLTYPLRDIPLPDELFVPSNTSTQVILPFSQVGVTYELIDTNGVAVMVEGVPGDGGSIALPTPNIDEDKQYRVRAVKTDSSPPREVILLGTVSIQEGVDPNLIVQMAVQFQGTTFVQHGAQAKVLVYPAQANVRYWLHAGNSLAPYSATAEGNEGETLELTTNVSMTEDIDLYVRGKLLSGNNDEKDMIARAQVRVLPNLELTVTLDAGVVDYSSGANLVIQNAQSSVRYQVWGRTVASSEYVFVGNPASDVLPIQGNGETLADLLGVERPVIAPPDGLAQLGPALAGPGNGTNLALAFGPITEDTILFLRASKRHLPGHLGEPGCWFEDPLIVLVRPNHAYNVANYDVAIANGDTTGPLMLIAGQPGVFYQLVDPNTNDDVGPALYVHDNQEGIDVIHVNIDFVVADEGTMPSFDLDPPLHEGTNLDLRAIKAITGISRDIVGSFVIDVTPNFQYPVQVPSGDKFAIRVDPGEPDELYLLAAGGSYSPWFEGKGQSLELWYDSIKQTTNFVVYVIRRSVGQVPLTRRYAFTVEVI